MSFRQIGNGRLYLGDCIEVLSTFPDKSIHCCVTSPPYYGLRDYGTGKWDGGDPGCDHKSGRFERGGLSYMQSTNSGSNGDEVANVCPKCGAVRVDNQIGLEETPDLYIQRLVEVFREVRRVLRDDGTLWLNLGDSYVGSGGWEGCKDGSSLSNSNMDKKAGEWKSISKGLVGTGGLKRKDLMGIPWMAAFALRADGWYLRQDIIWHKPNPMPESVLDRCTRSHEYIFLMSKSPKYYYDSKAVREESADKYKGKRGTTETRTKMQSAMRDKSDKTAMMRYSTEGRNRRSVWTITTKPFKGAHFATFPPDLIEPCILAGSPKGGIVLDPFSGSGTTVMVALKRGRRGIGIDLNSEYVDLAEKRISNLLR